MELESIEGIGLEFDNAWLVGIQFIHLSQGMINSLNYGIQKIPSSSFLEPNITNEFVVPIPSNFFGFRKPNTPSTLSIYFLHNTNQFVI